jgi:hypothetical protein
VEFTQTVTAAIGLEGKAAIVPEKRMRTNPEGNDKESKV